MESNITLKQCLFLLISTNLKYCEVWDYFQYWDYRITKGNGNFAMARKSAVLQENGYSRKSIYRNILFGGDDVSKVYNKCYRPKPVLKGSIQKVSNSRELWDKKVFDISFYGFLNRKVRILITEPTKENNKNTTYIHPKGQDPFFYNVGLLYLKKFIKKYPNKSNFLDETIINDIISTDNDTTLNNLKVYKEPFIYIQKGVSMIDLEFKMYKNISDNNELDVNELINFAEDLLHKL